MKYEVTVYVEADDEYFFGSTEKANRIDQVQQDVHNALFDMDSLEVDKIIVEEL